MIFVKYLLYRDLKEDAQDTNFQCEYVPMCFKCAKYGQAIEFISNMTGKTTGDYDISNTITGEEYHLLGAIVKVKERSDTVCNTTKLSTKTV